MRLAKTLGRARLAGGALVCFLALRAPIATAKPHSAAPKSEVSLADSLQGEAKAAFDSANVLIANHDFAGASTKLNQAYALSKDPRLLFNMAICEKNLQHYARTQMLLKQYEHDASANLSQESRDRVEDALHAINNLVGAVKVIVSETGAAVTIDGADLGTTPLAAPIPLDLGTHTLAVRKGGFDPFEKSLDVAGGNEIAVTVTLVKNVATARLTVSADSGATVRVDDAPSAVGSFAGSVAPGSHIVKVTESGKIPYAATVDVRDGENRTLEVTLENEHRGVVWPWIVGGAAIAVAGAAVGGYFLFKSSSGGSGEPGAPPTGGLGTVNFQSFGR